MRRSILASILVVALIGLSNPLMAQDSGLWLITRTHAEFRDWQDCWGKTCHEVRGDSILGFFQRLWRELPPLPEDYYDRDRDDPDAVTSWFRDNMGELYPHALTGLAEAIHGDGVPMPTTEVELEEALVNAMWWAPNPDGLRLTSTSLRVAMDESVFLMATADEVAKNPEVWSFPLWTERSLPEASDPERNVVVPEYVRRLLPAGLGEGWVYASCGGVEGTPLQPQHDGPQRRPAGSLWTGVRIPGLAEYLRSNVPRGDGDRAWPDTWLNLRSYVGPADEIGDAWRTFASLSDPEFPLYGDARATLLGPHDASHRAFLERRDKELAEEPADAQVGEHVLAMPTFAMADPTILFDDVWAASHPDLAASIMRWNAHWDPLHAEWDEDQRTRIQEVSDSILFGATREFTQLGAVPDLLASSLDESRLYVLRGRNVDVWDVGAAKMLESFELDHDCAGILTGEGTEVWTLDRAVGEAGFRIRVYENGLGSEPRIVDLGDVGAGRARPVGLTVCGTDLAILDAEGKLLLVEDGDTWTRKAMIRTGIENGRGLGSLGGPVTTQQGNRLVTFDVSGERPKAIACEFAGEVALLLGTPTGFWAVRPGGRLDRIDLAPFPEVRVELVSAFVEPERRDGESEIDYLRRSAGERKRAASAATWRLDGETVGEAELLERIRRRVLDPAAKRTDLSGKEWQPWVFVTPVGEIGVSAFVERVERLQEQLPEEFLVASDLKALSGF